MFNHLFIGGPPKYIKDYIFNHSFNSTPFFEKVIKNLEIFPECTLKDLTYTDDLVKGVLPSVGSSIPVDYKVDINGDFVTTEWIVMGYNMSIPEFVKYKNGDSIVYVSTMTNGLLTDIVSGAKVYSGKGSETDTGKTVQSVSGSFTYGNNCTYSVPKSVMVDGVEYMFVGYNMTIQSRCTLTIKHNDITYGRIHFHKSSPVVNDWANSEVRKWLNTNGSVVNAYWYPDTGSTSITGVDSFIDRLSNDFLNFVGPTVNRTWVHPSWTSGKILDVNQCEHVVDKFWLLGEGNINYNYQYLNDYPYDTSIFRDIFTQNAQASTDRIRYQMSEDGTVSSTARPWWIRSAGSGGSNNIGYINSTGFVGNYYTYYYYGCLPAATIY